MRASTLSPDVDVVIIGPGNAGLTALHRVPGLRRRDPAMTRGVRRAALVATVTGYRRFDGLSIPNAGRMPLRRLDALA